MAKSTNRGEGTPRRGRRRTDVEAGPIEAQTPLADDRPTPPAAAPQPLDTARMSLRDADTMPSPEAIARRAYEIYQQRGGGHGRDLEDWLRAERELREAAMRRTSSRTH